MHCDAMATVNTVSPLARKQVRIRASNLLRDQTERVPLRNAERRRPVRHKFESVTCRGTVVPCTRRIAGG